jgi:hypothetical protein
MVFLDCHLALLLTLKVQNVMCMPDRIFDQSSEFFACMVNHNPMRNKPVPASGDNINKLWGSSYSTKGV